MTGKPDPGARSWVDEAEEALKRTGDALRAAWEGTREARMSTLEAAKEAAGHLGVAIDQGIEVARVTWEPSPDGDQPSDGEVSSAAGE